MCRHVLLFPRRLDHTEYPAVGSPPRFTLDAHQRLLSLHLPPGRGPQHLPGAETSLPRVLHQGEEGFLLPGVCFRDIRRIRFHGHTLGHTLLPRFLDCWAQVDKSEGDKSPFTPAPTAASTAAPTAASNLDAAGGVLTPEEFSRLCFSPPLQGTQVC